MVRLHLKAKLNLDTMKKIILLLAILLPLCIAAKETTPAFIVKVSGKGQPIMLIPGFTVPGESWESTVAYLENDYQCHVITLAGFGGNAPIAFPWLPSVNSALERYILNKNLNNLTIIGHSLGGTVATWLANATCANNITKLVLVDALPAAGALMIPNFDPNALSYDSPYNQQQLAMSNTNFEQMAARMALGMSVEPKNQEQIKDWILQADRKTYVYGYTDYLKLDLRDTLKKIDIPVTILAAEKPFGAQAVTQTYQQQYANLDHYNFIIAKNAGHFMMLDKPEWFKNQLAQILADL